MLIEGYVIKLKDGSYWVVKGCYQPENGVIAVPRYINGLKIKKLSEAFNVIRRKYNHFVKYVTCLGKEVPVVPYDFIEKVYNPLNYTEYIRSKHESMKIYKKALELAEIFKHAFNHEIGITGSLIISKASESSDIDLVLYGISEECSHVIAKKLMKMFKQGILKHMSKYDFLEELNEVGEVIDAKDHMELIKHKLLQGIYDGFKYTLRLIRCNEPEECNTPTETVGYIDVYGIIINDSAAFLTPTEYDIKILKVSSLTFLSELPQVKLHSLRVRFTELGSGTIFKAHALLQRSGDKYLLNLDDLNTYFKIITYNKPTLMRA